MAETVVGFLVEYLTELVRHNAEVIGSAQNNIKSLVTELSMLEAVIMDLSEMETEKHLVKDLMNRFQALVDEAEDAVDIFVAEKAIFKFMSVLEKTAYSIPHFLRIKAAAEEIVRILEEVKKLFTEKQFAFAHSLKERSRKRRTFTTDEKKPHLENVVAFDEEETVIGRLIEKDEDLDIVAVVGVSGIGKTTLARKIYEDPRIENEFVTRAWVFVSENYSKRKVFVSILSIFKQATNYSDKSDEDIDKEVYKCLEEADKYLIVLDDVCSQHAWDDLEIAFSNNKKGSRILITSQDTNLRRYVSPNKAPHRLETLDANKSWEVIKKKVFGNKKCSNSIEAAGKEIARKCEGLRVLIMLTADILSSNRQLRDWGPLVKEFNSFSVLELSFNHLTYQLKSCFLYLGVFPVDYEIPVSQLVLLWIAEGFIKQIGKGRSLEEIAEACVEELADRRLVMVAQTRHNGKIKTCRVHGIIHRFCKQESNKMQIEIQHDDEHLDQYRHLDEHRRVCIHSGVEKYVGLKPSGRRMRSFLCFAPGEENTSLPEIHISAAISKAFRLLRVLEIRAITFEIFPRDLLQLALLRYIAISCKIHVLPSNISSRLWNMQTMILITTSPTLQLKEDVWKMYQLRHLHTNASALLLPPPPRPPSRPIHEDSMQTLSWISPQSCTEKILARIPNIRKLGIRGNLVAVNFIELFNKIGNLQLLTNLKLLNDVDFDPSSSQAKVVRLPPPQNFQIRPQNFPRQLQKLTLSRTLLHWEHMKILGDLEKLEELKLKEYAFKGEFWDSRDDGFKSLKLLHIGKTDLAEWIASTVSFRNLTHLVLQDCQKLQQVPFALANVPSFKRLKLHRTNKAVAVTAKRIQRERSQLDPGFKLDIYPPDK